MSQVVPGNRQSGDYVTKRYPWKKPFLIVFHGAAASTYGFAICFQKMSATSALLYARTNPVMRVYGKCRFLTYNCLLIQFVAHSLNFSAHFFPRLRRQRDFFFTTFAFPVGMVVVTTFWAIWAIAGRENILPLSIEPYYPQWLNHITHTIIAPINLIELISYRHQFSSDRRSLISLGAYLSSYTAYLLFIRWRTGRFVYPFLNKMGTVPITAYIIGIGVFALVLFKAEKIIHDVVHGVKSVKKNFRSGRAVAEKETDV